MKLIRKKWKPILACLIAAFVCAGCLAVLFTVADVETGGADLEFVSQSGTKESIEAIGETYDDSGFFVSSFYDTEEGRKYNVRKIGSNNAVEFVTELEQAEDQDGMTDGGNFRSVFSVGKNRALAFTTNWYYLYELNQDGLELLDVYSAALDVEQYTYTVHEDGSIDIYNLETRGSSSTARVYIEKISITNDRFVGSTYGEIMRKSGRRLTGMGAIAMGVSVTPDRENVMAVFSSGTAVLLDSSLAALEITDAEEYAELVKSIFVGPSGSRVTVAKDYRGKGELYVALQDRSLYRVTENSFAADGEIARVAETGEYGSYAFLDCGSGILYLTNEDGNTVYAVDTENGEVLYGVALQFKIQNMVASEGTNLFVCQWIDSVTEIQKVTVYSYDGLRMIGFASALRIVLIVAAVLAGLVALFFLVSVFWQAFADAGKVKAKWFFGNVWKSKGVYLAIAPSFILLCLFSIYPSISAIINSFFDYELGKPKIFVGLENYRELFVLNGGLFLEIGRNTVLMVVTYLFTQIVPPILYAYLIMLLRNQNSVKYIRLLLYIPGVLPTIATMLMWRYGIYGINPNGALNAIISNFGGTPIPFLGSSDYAIWSILLIGFPWVGGFLLFYGALMNVPGEVYDACELDGCGLLRRFISIDLPFIMGQVKYVSVGAVIAGVKSVGRVMATTEGQMGTMTMMYKLYDYLNQNRYGMASAVAVVMVLILAGISIVRVRKMLKREQAYD